MQPLRPSPADCRGTALPLSGFPTTPIQGTLDGNAFTLGDNSTSAGVMQVLPIPVTFTKISAIFTWKTAMALIGTTVTTTAQLYKYSGGTSAPVPGASCSALLTGILATGTISTCTNSFFSAAYDPGEAGFIVVSATSAGLSLINTLNLNVSVGVGQ
ncbi:MAG: hypothetical protein ACJ74Y_15800 [Bryobacteraceae bacterium]